MLGRVFLWLTLLFLLNLSRGYLLRRQLGVALGAWYVFLVSLEGVLRGLRIVIFAYSRNMTFPIKAHRGNADSCRSGHSSGHFSTGA